MQAGYSSRHGVFRVFAKQAAATGALYSDKPLDFDTEDGNTGYRANS